MAPAPSIDQSCPGGLSLSLGGRRRVITYAADHVVRALRGGTTLARCIRCSRPRSAAATRRDARRSRSQCGPYWNVKPHCLSPRSTFSGPLETPAERISVKLSAWCTFQGIRTLASDVAVVATPDGASVKEASRSLRTLESCQSVHCNGRGHSSHSFSRLVKVSFRANLTQGSGKFFAKLLNVRGYRE